MGSSPLGSSTATLWSPHSTFLMGEAQAWAASEVGANTITLVGAASSPCLLKGTHERLAPPQTLLQQTAVRAQENCLEQQTCMNVCMELYHSPACRRSAAIQDW